MRVCLDPGHGGRDMGASAVADRYEKESNLRCAFLLRTQLDEMGAGVLLTRSDDRDLTLAERADLANRWLADVFISLHADWAPNLAAQGHHAIHSVFSSRGQGSNRLARFLVDHLTEMTGRDPWPRGDRGIWSRWNRAGDADYYGVIRMTQMPAVILERGFLSNAEDADLLFDDSSLQM